MSIRLIISTTSLFGFCSCWSKWRIAAPMRCRNVPYAFRSSARVAGRGLSLMWVAELRGKAAQQRRQLRGLLLSLSTDQAAGTVDVNRVPPARQIRCSGLIANTIRRPGGSIPESASSMGRAWTRMSCDEDRDTPLPASGALVAVGNTSARHLGRGRLTRSSDISIGLLACSSNVGGCVSASLPHLTVRPADGIMRLLASASDLAFRGRARR
ncbi:hypothetical protein PJN26_11255 [Mycobacterium kansasii]